MITSSILDQVMQTRFVTSVNDDTAAKLATV